MKAASEPQDSLPLVLITLMKGVLWREDNEKLWHQLFTIQGGVRDHVAALGLRLEIDEAEGYAYLKQRTPSAEGPELPRLISRRPLSYPVSLLLVLLRKKLAEQESGGSDRRLVMSRADLVDLVRQFLRDTTNEAKLIDRVEGQIAKVSELGFLRRLRGRDDEFEVSRLLKAFVDAEWLDDFERRLADYRRHAKGETTEPKGAE